MAKKNLVPTEATTFSDSQVDLIKSTVAKGATDDELKLFLYQAKRTGLDPLARQIYFVKRGPQATIQTSIDGYRVIAERNGSYAGQGEPEWEEDEQGRIKKCTVKVYRFAEDGQRYLAGVGVAYWSEYCPATNDFMWKKMGHTMIAKCAEALALRKAFPQDLSGIYTEDEMRQADEPEEHVKVVEEPQQVQVKTIEYDANDDFGITHAIEEMFNVGDQVPLVDSYGKDNFFGHKYIDRCKVLGCGGLLYLNDKGWKACNNYKSHPPKRK